MDIDTDSRAFLPALDVQDQPLAHALQIDGRAPFSRIAEVLGVSDQTVARRYTRLRTTSTLRVVGLTDPLRVGDTWFVRVRCTPDAAGSVGEALARHPDTSWVKLTSGGTEIICNVRTHEPGHPGESDALLLQKLPRTPRVVDVSAHSLLHVFFGRKRSAAGKSGPLTPEQVAALTPADAPACRPDEPAAPYPLDARDHRLLAVLAQDGRAPLGELAAATGWSQTTVRRRLAELRAAGVLYFDLDYHPRILQHGFRATLWLQVEPARLDAVGRALAEHPEVPFAAATTGTTNLFASISTQSAGSFYRYLTGPVASLPGVQHASTAPTHRILKGPGPRWPQAGAAAKS
ncbi:AsnC family transcriptional regulator [Streptomyces griseocarneus]|nr:AsnC family transcriptional regulator [Streptomyces griseocarneus]MBZ6477738.1 AsnC family transcriptional regulator [Streptomyces griseocarneus]